MKRTRIRSISKRDDRTMERKLDALWQKAVIARSGGRCRYPSCRRMAVVGHHVVGRDNKPTRHMVCNGFAVCQNHHDWIHAHPKEFIALLAEKFLVQYSVWETRHWRMTVPYHVWMEERMKELSP